jgi:general stress protein 26
MQFKRMKLCFQTLKLSLVIAGLIHFPRTILAQEIIQAYNRDSLIAAARQMMAVVPNCALITLDATGHPDARTMDPFPPDDDMVVWLGTNEYSRKVKQIEQDPRVTLYYEGPGGTGYVLIKGNASIVNDSKSKLAHWKKDWEQFYSKQKGNYTLIKVVPFKLEILDISKGIVGDPETWTVPSVEFDNVK